MAPVPSTITFIVTWGESKRTRRFGEQLSDAPVPFLVVAVVEMELAIPGVANRSRLVDQHEARPITDAVRVPGAAVVVLRVGIGDALAVEGPGEVALVVLAGVGRGLGRVNADDREPAGPIPPIVGHERRHGPRAVAPGENPEVEQHYPAPELRKPQRLVAVEPAGVGQFRCRRAARAGGRGGAAGRGRKSVVEG